MKWEWLCGEFGGMDRERVEGLCFGCSAILSASTEVWEARWDSVVDKGNRGYWHAYGLDFDPTAHPMLFCSDCHARYSDVVVCASRALECRRKKG